ncbi:MAG: hypothetical protein JO119_00780 [Acidobacteria bacterium]|nr:hypothetical protein [Acidobacteriota bacterium]
MIHSSTQTIYLVTKSKTSSANYVQRLHALSLTTGAEATNSPVTIAAIFPGTCEGGSTDTFNALTENQRAALALSNGMVYIPWGSHGDQGTYEGWILGYQTGNLTAVPTVFVDDPNTCQGGIWMSGGAPSFDSAGNIYVISGNGGFNGTSGSSTLPADFGDSYMKLSAPNLGVVDYFTPFNQSALDSGDNDAGASGTSVLIDGTGGGNFLVGGSKSGTLYLISRDNMGKYNTTGDSVTQEWTPSSAPHSFSTPAFWNNSLYYFGVASDYGASGDTQPGQVFTFNTSSGMFNTTAASATPTGFGFAGATPSISGSSATANGIVWAIDTGAYGTSDNGTAAAGPAILHAYDATNLGNELWNSSQNVSRDPAGNAVKFTVPTVANGKVYIGTRGSDNTVGGGTTFGELDVYGLLP